MAPDAVTFDFWNTLCREPPGGYLRSRRLEEMGKVMARAGVGDAGAELATAYDAAWLTYVESWQANRQYTGRHAARHIADHVVGRFGLNGDLRERLLAAFAAASAAEETELLLVEGVSDAVASLRRLGIPLAIVCDVGFTPSPVLRRHLERHRLLGCFDAWAFSDEVGVYKPDRRIFEHALSRVGASEPARCVHIGDRRRTDVAGASALGMKAVRLTAAFDDDDPDEGPPGDVVLSSYEDLLPALGLA
jgi:putative hydrolase of the HAD superfamily